MVDWAERKAKRKAEKRRRTQEKDKKARRYLGLNIPNPTNTTIIEAEARRKAQRVELFKNRSRAKTFFEKRNYNRKGL